MKLYSNLSKRIDLNDYSLNKINGRIKNLEEQLKQEQFKNKIMFFILSHKVGDIILIKDKYGIIYFNEKFEILQMPTIFFGHILRQLIVKNLESGRISEFTNWDDNMIDYENL